MPFPQRAVRPLRPAVCTRVTRKASAVVTFVAVSLLGATAATSEDSVPGRTVESIHTWLLDHNAELRALTLEAEAARARIVPAGALPDPTVAVLLGGRDPEQPWRAAQMGRETEYSLRQRYPLWGKRSLARTVAREEAAAAGFERSAAALDLVAQAEAAYVRYWHADQAVAVLARRTALLEQVQEIAGIRYALGTAAQQDSIRAQVEQTSVARERIERLAIRSEAVAMLNSLLARRADAPLAEPEGIPSLPVESDDLSEVLELATHPSIRAQHARAEAARTNVALERRNRFPDVTVGVGAMQIGNGLESTELMLEVEIPFQQRARRERERESRLLEEAALARTEATLFALESRGATAWSQWTSARERRELAENTLMPQADATFQSALASYQVGSVDFGTLLEALNEWQAADLARVDALRDELLGAAALRAIEGEIQ